ncbi:hypothetical protein [Microbulbifer pacificus]|uniref:Uncharacterized protein n=1 Tax=Microbulbifer pacificus TaxID=407164 RepID=A0AAU0MYX8_9GAMM|nr:hypothetical protein [Microbulbifer pacificus]WOX05218.1 hypothetical protein R5R33_15950 [Microbulbifer pacificus]
MEVFFPELGHTRQVAALDCFHPGGAVYQPGDGGGVAQVGGEFGVGVLQEVALAGQSAYFRGERGEIDQVFIPYLSVGAGQNLEYAHAVARALFEMESQFGFLCCSSEEQ